MTEASELYRVAYATHYTREHLGGALDLYAHIIAGYPDTPEAGYCRSQINNIVKRTVPESKFIEAQIELANLHIQAQSQSVIEIA